MAVSIKERQRISHELKRMGFGGLDDPGILDQLAFCIHSHEGFRGMLMSVKPSERKIAYDAMAHRLRFTPKPLDVYEREARERAEREQWDTWNGTPYPDKFRVGEVESEDHRLDRLAQEAIEQNTHDRKGGVLEMVCTKCTVAQNFPALKRKEAVKKAYDAGWRWHEVNGTRKQYCPEHVPGRASMTLECSECGKRDRIRVWDEQDGYRAARRLGWEIGDAAKCPKCLARIVIVQ